jgi:hypothetical protein
MIDIIFYSLMELLTPFSELHNVADFPRALRNGMGATGLGASWL